MKCLTIWEEKEKKRERKKCKKKRDKSRINRRYIKIEIIERK